MSWDHLQLVTLELQSWGGRKLGVHPFFQHIMWIWRWPKDDRCGILGLARVVTMSGVAQTECRDGSASKQESGSGIQAAQNAHYGLQSRHLICVVREERKTRDRDPFVYKQRLWIQMQKGFPCIKILEPGNVHLRVREAGGHPGVTLVRHDGHSVRAGPDG